MPAKADDNYSMTRAAHSTTVSSQQSTWWINCYGYSKLVDLIEQNSRLFDFSFAKSVVRLLISPDTE